MINFTLTIMAAPELLAAMTSFTSAITAAKVVTIPEYNSDFTAHKASREKTSNSYNLPAPQALYQEHSPSIQQGMGAQETMHAQAAQQASVQTAPTQGTSVPTSAQSYTMEQLAVAATQIVDAGRRIELVSLLNSFGVQALTALPKEQYGSFATQLRALGAKI
jgi:CCR4-NOT transcriptional regulation complex NOT5 subunit